MMVGKAKEKNIEQRNKELEKQSKTLLRENKHLNDLLGTALKSLEEAQSQLRCCDSCSSNGTMKQVMIEFVIPNLVYKDYEKILQEFCNQISSLHGLTHDSLEVREFSTDEIPF